MSQLAMTTAEQQNIDSKVEQMMDWAKTRKAEAEQLALDSTRLMACATDRLDRLSKQGFFKRCWSRFNGEANAMERANVNDVVQMQKTAFRYVNILQEQQLLMAHSLLSLKNNLYSLAVKEEETRNLIAMLAQRTKERFEKLENRVEHLEISSNLQGWLLGLEERDYKEKIPTEYMRMFRVINDFYNIKKDDWNYNDLMFMRKALRTVGLDPKQEISLNTFIDKLTDEIQSDGVGFDVYEQAITMFAPPDNERFSTFAIDNISSPVFATLHGLKTQYADKMDAVEALQDSLSISTTDALKVLLRQSIKGMNVNLDYEFSLAETAIEILGCLRLIEKLTEDSESNDSKTVMTLQSNEQENEQQMAQELYNNLLESFVSLPIDDFRENSFFRDDTGKIIGEMPSYMDDLLKKYPDKTKDNLEIFIALDTKGIGVFNAGEKFVFDMMDGKFLTIAIEESNQRFINLCNSVSEMLREATKPPLQILTGMDAWLFIIEAMKYVGKSSIKLEKDKLFLESPKKNIHFGKLPEDIYKIIYLYQKMIPLKDISMFIETDDFCLWDCFENKDNNTSLNGAFSRRRNIYAIIDWLQKEDRKDIEKKVGNIEKFLEGEWKPTLQLFADKMVQTFPEFEAYFG